LPRILQGKSLHNDRLEPKILFDDNHRRAAGHHLAIDNQQLVGWIVSAKKKNRASAGWKKPSPGWRKAKNWA
jgi:hypothetical protein